MLSIVNKIKLLGNGFTDSKIVEKILVTMLERYEAYIASLENTKNLSKITLTEVLHALQAQEQRRLMRTKKIKQNQESSNENTTNNQIKGKGRKKNYPPCQHCGRKGHPPYSCWKRLDTKYSKCN